MGLTNCSSFEGYWSQIFTDSHWLEHPQWCSVLQKYFSHPSLVIIYFFPNPTHKTESVTANGFTYWASMGMLVHIICKRILVMTTMTQNPNKGITIKIHLSSFRAALFSISCSHNKVDQVTEPVATLKFPYSSTLNPKILLTVNSSSKYLLS